MMWFIILTYFYKTNTTMKFITLTISLLIMGCEAIKLQSMTQLHTKSQFGMPEMPEMPDLEAEANAAAAAA